MVSSSAGCIAQQVADRGYRPAIIEPRLDVSQEGMRPPSCDPVPT
jgi:hypothetical protein